MKACFIMMKIIWFFLIILFGLGCKMSTKRGKVNRDIISATVYQDTNKPLSVNDSQRISNETIIQIQKIPQTILGVTRHDLVSFAETLIGVPYKYASIEPTIGFDCSGFITYVFNHFNIKVPRSSVDFTYVGKEISLKNAMEGDLILFTGTVDPIRIVGHMGIVTENNKTLKFIHSTSGRANGVTNSEFSDHYKRRFVKVVRIFPD